jgi:hypothetical protein
VWSDEHPDYSGELIYVLTREVEKYRLFHGDCYQTFNDIIGALEGAKQEFYRRIVAPYEDKKMIENGDVYNGPTRKAEASNPTKELRSEGVDL